jgi:hypothetical protein
MEAYKNMPSNTGEFDEHLKLIKIVKEELENSLKRLSNPTESIT